MDRLKKLYKNPNITQVTNPEKNSCKVWETEETITAYTFRSENKKTGDMAQVSHLVKDRTPTKAVKDRVDGRICGDCPLKHGKICYVNLLGFNTLYRQVIGDKPLMAFPKWLKPVRFGAYGDSALGIPFKLLSAWCRWLKRHKLKWTGYTHQWHKIDKKWAKYLMASIDDLSARTRTGSGSTVELKRKANKKGWRTYRILKDWETPLEDEVLCPFYTHNIQCRDCGLCAGTTIGAKNIAAYVHGAPNKVSAYLKEGVE